jgi:hypothetical protein
MVAGTPDRAAAMLSGILPGFGQARNGQFAKAAEIVTLGAMLAAAWYMGYAFDGPFSGLLIYLTPFAGLLWWMVQVQDAYSSSPKTSVFPVLPRPSRGCLDVQVIGLVFFFAILTDLYIIQARPQYGLKILGATLPGMWGVAAKAQSPILHAVIGLGLITLKRWGFLVYLVYAVWGVINALVNLSVLPGPHRIRIIFIVSLAVFTGYLWWRRRCLSR